MSSNNNDNEIRCGGCGMLLSDGTFAFAIDVTVQDRVFKFESIDTFTSEEEMLYQLDGCMAEFPHALIASARSQDFQIMEEFFAKWNIVKIIEADEAQDEEEKPQGTLH